MTAWMDSNIFWSAVVVAGFPLAMVVLSELRHATDNSDARFKRLLALLQNTVLPLIAIYLLLVMVVGYDRGETLVRLVETALAVMILNAALALLNLIIFADWSGENAPPKVPGLLLDLMRLLLVLLGTALIVSTIWDVDLQGLLTALGVGSVVLGLALQDTLSGLFAGIAIISGKHFKQDDWLQVGDKVGRVIAMDWRSITIETELLEHVVIPNSELAKQQFAVLSSVNNPFGREIVLQFSYQQSPDRIMEAIMEAAGQTPLMKSAPPPDVEMLTFDEYGTSFEFKYFTNDYTESELARSTFMSRLWFVCQRRGIEIPAKFHHFYRHHSDEFNFGESAESRLALFERISDIPADAKGLDSLAEQAFVQRYQADEVILKYTDEPRGVYAVLSGALTVKAGHVESDGKPVWIDSGTLFAMPGFMSGQPSSVEICANDATDVLVLPAKAFRTFLEANPKQAKGFNIKTKELERVVADTSDSTLASSRTR